MAKLLDLPPEIIGSICQVLLAHIPPVSGYVWCRRPYSTTDWAIQSLEIASLASLRLTARGLFSVTTLYLFETIPHASPSFGRLLRLRQMSTSRIAPHVKRILWSLTPSDGDTEYSGISDRCLFPQRDDWEQTEAAMMAIILEGFQNLCHIEFTGRCRGDIKDMRAVEFASAAKKAMESLQLPLYLKALDGEPRLRPPSRRLSTVANIAEMTSELGISSPPPATDPAESQAVASTLPAPETFKKRSSIQTLTFHSSSCSESLVPLPFADLSQLNPKSFPYALDRFWNHSINSVNMFYGIMPTSELSMEEWAAFAASVMRCPNAKAKQCHFGEEGFLEWSRYARKTAQDAQAGVLRPYPRNAMGVEYYALGSLSLNAGMRLVYFESLRHTLRTLILVDMWVEPMGLEDGQLDGWAWYAAEMRKVFLFDERGQEIPGKASWFTLKILGYCDWPGGTLELLDIFYGRKAVPAKQGVKRRLAVATAPAAVPTPPSKRVRNKGMSIHLLVNPSNHN